MTILRSLFTFILVTVCLSAFGQSVDQSVLLKWKLKPGEVLTYKTIMNEVDTAHKSPDMAGMMKSMGMDKFLKSTGTKDKGEMAQMNKMMKELSKGLENYGLVTRLSERRKSVIDIEMATVENQRDTTPIKLTGKNSDDSLKNIGRMLSKMTMGNLSLRGAIYEDGRLESFYIPNGQKNLVRLFFELPGKPIKPGDTWSLDTHLISLDQNFSCDTSYLRNNVMLRSVEVVNGEHIADIEYDIVEYAGGDFKSPFGGESTKTTMKMTYHALAKFSVEKGRWVAYDGLMALSSTGFMEQQSTKQFSLIAE